MFHIVSWSIGRGTGGQFRELFLNGEQNWEVMTTLWHFTRSNNIWRVDHEFRNRAYSIFQQLNDQVAKGDEINVSNLNIQLGKLEMEIHVRYPDSYAHELKWWGIRTWWQLNSFIRHMRNRWRWTFGEIAAPPPPEHGLNCPILDPAYHKPIVWHLKEFARGMFGRRF
jgi:hypothetical protein